MKVELKMMHGPWKATAVVAVMLLALANGRCRNTATSTREHTVGTGPIHEAPASAKAPAYAKASDFAKATSDKPADKQGRPFDKAQGRPLKVFILAGQSNMQEPASWRTLAGLGDSPETKALYDKLADKDGKARVHKDIYVSNNGRSAPLGDTTAVGGFGPELGFGVTMYEKLGEPILIIKTAFGGKSLHTDFRPPTKEHWSPPVGHPDHPDTPSTLPPIPKSFELPEGFEPPGTRGKNMQVMQGLSCGEMNGLYPVYVFGGYKASKNGGLTDIPFKKGDIILGLNGKGWGRIR
jgi:hypothetical protein